MRWREIALGAGWLAGALVADPTAALELGQPRPPVTVSLWAERDGIAPGRSFTLALRLEHEPGWHTYWTVPGDAGLPTRVKWHLPAGISAGELQWPAPRRLPIGPLVDFGYQGETLLLTDLRVAPDLPLGGEVRIEAHAQWLMCHDVCIPGSKDLAVTLPVREASSIRPTDHAQAFEQTRERIPRRLELAAAQATRSGARIRLAFAAPRGIVPQRLEFFPLEPGRIEASAPQTLRPGTPVVLELAVARPPEGHFRMLRGVLVANGGQDPGGWIGEIEVPLTADRAIPAAAPN